MSEEIVIGKGPNRKFEEFLAAVLADAQISVRFASVCQAPAGWLGLLVSNIDEQKAKQIVEHTILNCKLCLHCEESFVKPGETFCPKCGKPVDPRHPGEIRKQYVADSLARKRSE